MNSKLTQQQLQKFLDELDALEQYRDLSDEEKEKIAKSILSSKYMDLRCDWAFKYILQNKEILTMLLRDFISEDIEHVEYLPNEIGRASESDKNIIMDVLCYAKSGQRFIVEMQCQHKTSFKNRMLYYGASMLHTQLNRAAAYSTLMPVYVICFTNFKLKHEADQLVYRYLLKERDTGELYNNLLTICFCELPRLKAKKIDGLNDIESWFYILKNIHTFVGEPGDYGERYKSVMEAALLNPLPDANKLQYFRAMVSEEERRDIAEACYGDGFDDGMAQGKAEGLAEGLAEGKAEGKAEGLEQMAKALAQMGMFDADIQKAIELAKNS